MSACHANTITSCKDGKNSCRVSDHVEHRKFGIAKCVAADRTSPFSHPRRPLRRDCRYWRELQVIGQYRLHGTVRLLDVTKPADTCRPMGLFVFLSVWQSWA